MRIVYLISFLLCTLTGQSQLEPYTVKNDLLNFELELPQKPTFSVDTVIKMNYYWPSNIWTSSIADTLHDNVFYSVQITPMLPDIMHSDSSYTKIETLLDESVNSFVATGIYQLVSANYEFKEGFPGKKFQLIRSTDGVSLEHVSYLVNSTLYELTSVSRDSRPFNRSSFKFHKSFKLYNLAKNTNDYDIRFDAKRSYEITFPEEASTSRKLVPSQWGPLNSEISIYRTEEIEANVAFLASETWYPDYFRPKGEELNAFYDSYIEETLRSTAGTLMESSDFTMGAHQGKYYKIEMTDGEVRSENKLIFIDGNLYNYSVIYRSYNIMVDLFLDSFKLIKS